MSDQIFWYLSRSAGLIAWLAAAGSILVGVMIPSRLLGRRPTIPWLVDLHRMLGAMASIFLVIHMVALWFDHFVQFRLDDLLIPGVATVPGLSRLSLALGVVAAWLMGAVELTSLVRDRLSPELWRTVHLTSYGVFVLGSLHAVLAGSDVANPLIAAVGVSSVTAVTIATIVRIRRGRRRRQALRPGQTEPPAPLDDAWDPYESPLIIEPTDPYEFTPDAGWAPPSRGGTRRGDAARRPGPWDRG